MQFSLQKFSRRWSGVTVIAAGLLALLTPASTHAAPVTVTGVTYGSESNGSNVDVNNIIYDNRAQSVNMISTGGLGDYSFNGPAASQVYFRRGSTGSNGATAWYQGTDFSSSNGGYTVYGQGDSSPTLSELMLTSNLSQGLRNPFANVSDPSVGPTSNIERIDFYFGSNGYTVQAGDALVFFDLENVGNHGDGFRIAAFKGWNSSNNTATNYANTGLMVAPGSYGDALDVPGSQTNTGYIRSTTTNGDNIGGTQTVATIDNDVSGSAGSSDLTIVGVLIRFSDLGLNVGDKIYGYSLMAGDVTATTASQLVDWTNTSVYKNTTNAGSNPNADYGNVDFAAFGAKISRPVPEPANYGVIFLGAAVGLFLSRRPGRTPAAAR